MRKNILFLVCLLVGISFCRAQGNYRVSGKISGISDGTLLLVRNDGPLLDTIATTLLKNGTFSFGGETDVPFGAMLMTADGALSLSMIVEPGNMMVNVTPNGVLIQGGEQQKLYAAYNHIGLEYAAEQAAILEEVQQPEADLEALQSRIDNAYRASVTQTLELVRANPDAYATAYVIALGIKGETEEGLIQKYELLGENARNSVPGKRITAAIERHAAVAVGREAPDFTVKRPNGDDLSLSSIPAKIKLLVFWAAWDTASRQANPELIKIYQQFRPKNFEIISISLDDNRFAWDRAIEQDGISIWSNGSDLRGTDSPVAKTYMVGSSLPYTVLIDEENKIVAKGLLGDELRKAVADLVKRKRK